MVHHSNSTCILCNQLTYQLQTVDFVELPIDTLSVILKGCTKHLWPKTAHTPWEGAQGMFLLGLFWTRGVWWNPAKQLTKRQLEFYKVRGNNIQLRLNDGNRIMTLCTI